MKRQSRVNMQAKFACSATNKKTKNHADKRIARA